jgi:hypothetical protein
MRAGLAVNLSTIFSMGLLSLLFGCGSGSGPYHKKDGEWYYKDNRMRAAADEDVKALNGTFGKSKSSVYFMGSGVSGADAATFEALNERYAKDSKRVYYSDTFRDGKEYFSIKHTRTATIAGADPASFRLVDERYARDRRSMYYEGVAFAVKDLESFQLLADNFAKDKISGYYIRRPIPESDGPTFSAIAGAYSKDATHVFYSGLNFAPEPRASDIISVVLRGARPGTFTPLESGYATDGNRAYYNDRLLEGGASSFRVLAYDYAVSPSHVYYRGDVVKGADAATFVTVPIVDGGPTAKDKSGSFNYANRVKR